MYIYVYATTDVCAPEIQAKMADLRIYRRDTGAYFKHVCLLRVWSIAVDVC